MTGPPAFEVLGPVGRRAPVVGHLPHASTRIPDEFRTEITLSDEELAEEVLRLTDWYTDELFGWLPSHGATCFVSRLSRLIFDPERFLDAADEPTEAIGQGVVYWRGSRGQSLRRPDPGLRAARVEQLYRPYHAALDALVADTLEGFGRCLLLDCHSFPSTPLPSELDQAPDRPDICIGTDAWHTPARLAEALEAAFASEGWRVRRDSPFAGAFVPGGLYRRDRRVQAVMIEVRRSLYLDETSGDRRADFAQVSAAIERATAAALAAA